MMQRFWLWTITLVLGSIVALVPISGAAYAATTQTAPATRTVWLQVMDSCQQALPGPVFTIYDSKHTIAVPAGPAAGTKRVTVARVSPNCPLQRGNCLAVPTGCVAWSVAIPKSGTSTYTIKQTVVLSRWVPCDGGLTCRSEMVTLTIDAKGRVAATTKNVYGTGKAVFYPYTGPAFTATQTDPIVFHDYETPA